MQETHITVRLSPRACTCFLQCDENTVQCIKHCWHLHALLHLQTERINDTRLNVCMFAVFLAHGRQQSFPSHGPVVVAVISCATVTFLLFFTWPICFCQPAAAAAKAMLVVPLVQFFKRAPSRPEGSLMRDAGANT